MDFKILQARIGGLGAGVGWVLVMLGAAVPACNAPSSSGLFMPFRPDGSGGGGAPSNAGAGGPGMAGGSAGTAGDLGLGGSAGGGGGALGGGGASGSSIAGMGGNDAGAGRSDAGDNADAGLDAGPDCGGSLLDGICWYLGPADQSCDQVCTTRGGFNAAATSIVGTPAQGGTIENCSALMQLLLGNADDPVVEGTQVAGNGVGCHLFAAQAGQRWWLTEPEFSPAVAVVGARVVCGCND